jgi:hypothetical protein
VSKKKKTPNYRELKKTLNKYQSFSFKMPPKGKDFTPQQKSALTRTAKKIKSLINDNDVSFIKYPKGSKLPHVDGVRTTDGIFYKFPDAKVEYSKTTKKFQVVVRPKSRGKKILGSRQKRILFTFPPSVINNPQAITKFIDALRAKFPTSGISWSTPNKRASAIYDESRFNFYFSIFVLPDDDIEIEDSGDGIDESEFSDEEVVGLYNPESKDKIWRKRKFEQKLGESDGYYNGVFVVIEY